MSNYYTYRYATPLTWTFDSEADSAAFTSATFTAPMAYAARPDWQTWAMGHTLGAYCPLCPSPGKTPVPHHDRRYVTAVDRTGLSLSCNTHPMFPGGRERTHTSWELVRAYFSAVDKPVPPELAPDPTWGEYGL